MQVLVRDDGSYCRMMNPSGPSAGYSPNAIDPALFNKLNLTDIYRQQVNLLLINRELSCNSFFRQFQMAYGLHPQLYPYLYAPKNPLTIPSTYENSEVAINSRHKFNRERDEDDKLNHDESSSGKGDEDCAIDESENVEID